MSLLNSALIPSVLPGQISKSESVRKSWKTSQLVAQDFWLQWQRIYLPTLVPRKKWNKPRPNFKEGELILLKDSSMVKNQWSRGWIYRVLPNKDGNVRCVEILKPDGTILSRDVQSICKLEVDIE